MPPCTAGSAHLNDPELIFGVASAVKCEEGPAMGAIPTIQRQVNSGAEASSDHASLPGPSVSDPSIEGFNKRRRVVHDTTLQPLTHTSFGSDVVRALFNPEPAAVTSGQAQPNRSASIPVTSMTASFGPDLPQNITGPSGPGGSILQTDVHNTMPAFSGVANNTGKLGAFESTNTPGSMPCGNKVSGVQFTPQATSFVIPGLGALFKPLHIHSSKKTSSPPAKTCASATVEASFAQVEQKANDGAACQQLDLQPSAPKQVSSGSTNTAAATEVGKPIVQRPASSDAPATPKKLQATTSPPGVSKESEYVRPSGSPPVWIEKQIARTIKPLRAQNNHRSFETFDGAHAILSGMNPDHYAMPYGSQVVAIKCPNLDDILMSHQTGFWATNQNVMSRIMDLHNSRENPSMKTLFLWSMPGSKHFCGLSELQAFNPNIKTDFWDKEAGKWIKLQGSMMIQWIYCKLVAYDEVIPLVEGKVDQGSITQMWNGMYYTEATGREVVKAYIEAPHVENLLAAPTTEFFRRAMENSKIATVPPMGPKFFGRGGHRGRGIYRPSRRGAFENGKTDTRAQLASVSGSATKQERKEYSSSTQTTATSPEHFRDRGKPELKIMPVLTYADGTMTTAPDVNGNTVPVTHCGTSTGMQTSRAERSNSLTQVQAQTQAQSSRAVRSNSLVQAQGAHTVQCSHVESLNSLAQTHGSRVEEPDSLAQTKSAHTLQSSNEHPMLNLSATVGTSVDVGAPMIQRKSAGIFNDATYRSSFEMAAPPKPSATTQHGPASHLEHRGFSAPRTTPQNDRFVNNIDTWSYPCLTPAQTLEFKTPASQSRNLFAMSVSPLDTSSRGTSTPHGVLLNTTPSRIGSQGKGTTYGFGQVPEKLRTPDSSPLAARGQLAQQLDTPHSAFRLDQADQDQEESKLKPHWVSVLVDNE